MCENNGQPGCVLFQQIGKISKMVRKDHPEMKDDFINFVHNLVDLDKDLKKQAVGNTAEDLALLVPKNLDLFATPAAKASKLFMENQVQHVQPIAGRTLTLKF